MSFLKIISLNNNQFSNRSPKEFPYTNEYFYQGAVSDANTNAGFAGSLVGTLVMGPIGAIVGPPIGVAVANNNRAKLPAVKKAVLGGFLGSLPGTLAILCSGLIPLLTMGFTFLPFWGPLAGMIAAVIGIAIGYSLFCTLCGGFGGLIARKMKQAQ